MPRNWYGNAQSARQAPRTANAVRTINAVGGMKHTVRAIYGSTDNAIGDHGNDALCRVATAKQEAALHEFHPYQGAHYAHNIFRYASHDVTRDALPMVESDTDETEFVPDIDFLLHRALARGMTLVAYCAMIGQPIA